MSDLISYFLDALPVRKRRKIIISYLLAVIGFIPVQVLAQNYITYGIGAYTEFNERTLLIKLELEAPATNPVEVLGVDTSKKLSFRIMQNLSPRAWSKIWIQSLSINNTPATLTAQTDDLITMTQALKGTLRTGDLVEFERVAPDLTIMTINGHEVGDFETPDFFEFLMSAYIGSIPPSSELKNKLLAGGSSFGDEAILFDSMGFTDQRAAQIAGWGIPAETAMPEAEVAIADETETQPEPEQELAPQPDDESAEAINTEISSSTEAAEEVGADGAGEAQQVATAENEPVSGQEATPEPELAEEEADESPVRITAESLLAAQNYQRSVLQTVYQALEYPSIAQRRSREGSLRLAISINRNGS
ncbi:MAG: chalcone isomerase family protein, partial [Pseudohongiellaceae bacterium]